MAQRRRIDGRAEDPILS